MASSSTGTSQSDYRQSSASQPSESQAWQKAMEQASKPRTPAQIKAAGDISVKIGVLWLVGITCGILAFFGGVSFFLIPDQSKDMWVIFAPIITAGLTGTLAYLTGEKSGSSK